MLVRVLGEVSLLTSSGEESPLPGSRQSALLAALAARCGEVVSADRLVELLWGHRAPDNPSAALHSAVFKLRASLARAGRTDVLLTRDKGYVLALGPDDLDASVFTRLVDSARDVEPDTVLRVLSSALALWRGTAYGGFADTDVAYSEALRLEELRRVAVEQHAAALVETGRAAEAVSVLQPFVSEHPLRDSARLCLMRALGAVGRTADGLDQYQEHRRHLAEELGLEPSAALREAQAALLTGPAAAPRSTLQDLSVRYLRTAAGSTLAYGTAGEGPPVVVQLGWVSSLDVVASGRDPRSALLERLTGDLSLTLFDRTGSGLSPGPVSDFGLEASIDELTEVVRHVGPPVCLMAMSAAGPIALALAHRRPEWVDSLVLFGTFADAPGTFRNERLRGLVTDIARTSWTIGSKLFADLYRPGLSDEAAWHFAKVFRDSAEPEVAASYLEATYEYDASALLADIEVPALVLHYRGDRLIPFQGGQELARGLPNATFVPLDGQVHLPDAADVETIQRAIVAHVLRHATAGQPADRTS